MKQFMFVVILLLLSSPVFSQQQTTPLDQRIASQIGTLVIQNTSQGVQIETLQAQLTQAQSRIKELEARYELKPESAK